MAAEEGLEREYRERIMRALRYIEANLSRPIALEDAAAEAAWSFFHFRRIFQALMGLPPGEYLRARRLTEAARLLARGGASAASVALECGFGSPEAFSRSFKAQFGVTPGEYRSKAPSLGLMNPFGPSERPLAHRAPCLAGSPAVEDYGPIRLAAARRTFDVEDTELGAKINAFWGEREAALEAAAGRAPGSGLARSWGIAETDPERGGERIVYFAGVEPLARGPGETGLEEYLIPEGRYLLALHRGPLSRLNETYLYLYGTWLPRAGLRPGAAMDFDFYGPGYDRADPESARSTVEFRIPLATS